MDLGCTLLPGLLDQLGDKPGPSCLMAGSKTGPVVAMEVLVEKYRLAPERIFLKLPGPSKDRPSSGSITKENMG